MTAVTRSYGRSFSDQIEPWPIDLLGLASHFLEDLPMDSSSLEPHIEEHLHHPQALTEPQVDVLRHACLNQRFMAEPHDQDCVELHRLGLLRFAGEIAWCAGDHLYYPTREGRLLISSIDDRQRVKLTRSQLRYRAYLEEDSSMTFGEWLRERCKKRTDRAMHVLSDTASSS